MIVATPILISVTSGNTKILDCRSRNWQQPLSIVCIPGGGGTCEVLSSNDSDAVSNGAAIFVDSGSGAIDANKEVTRYAPCVAIKLKANTATATFKVMM